MRIRDGRKACEAFPDNADQTRQRDRRREEKRGEETREEERRPQASSRDHSPFAPITATSPEVHA